MPSSEPVIILAEEYVELEQGLDTMKGLIKRYAASASVLELEPGSAKLEERRQDLKAVLQGEPKQTKLPPQLLHAARVSLRIRHRDLVKLHADEKDAGVELNVDVRQRIGTCEALGRKLGIQLDALTPAAEPEPETEKPQLTLEAGGASE